jgi:hypothetical protein
MPWIGEYAQAVAIVPPGDGLVLEYSPSVSWMYKGQIGAPGTTRTQGVVLVSVALGVLFALLPLLLVSAFAL